jgi:hypothetical protein
MYKMVPSLNYSSPTVTDEERHETREPNASDFMKRHLALVYRDDAKNL